MSFNYSPKVVTNGLVLCADAANQRSYVSGSTKWNDLTSNLNNGTLYNGPTYSTSGSGCIVFDGVDDVSSVPLSINTSGNYTIEVIAQCNNMTADGNNRQTVFSLSTSTNGYQLLDFAIWGDAAKSFNGDGNNYDGPINIKNTVNANSWHTYTLSSSNGSWSWYFDGVLALTYTPVYTTTSLYFKLASRGAGASGSNQNWTGKISMYRVYNRALSATEILQNYNATKTRFGL
jgi:hypothetical protein